MTSTSTSQVAIVTGGAHGIGEGIARSLAGAGARVAIFDLDGDGAARTANDLQTDSIALTVDCIDETELIVAAADVMGQFGRLDIMVNNAGAGGHISRSLTEQGYHDGFMQYTQQTWDLHMTQNLRSTFVGAKAALPHIAASGGGSIVNVSSIAGLRASPGLTAYGAAKAGVNSLTKSLALEFASQDIRVNAICPGYLWTRVWHELAAQFKRADPSLADLNERQVFEQIVQGASPLIAGVPLGREQTPNDIGELAVFLTSTAARNITGQVIAVDGGITLR